MLQFLQAPLFFGLIAAFMTTLGLISVAVRGDWSARHSGLFALAAGGMLVTLSLVHIAPEAFARSTQAPWFILAGFLGGLMLRFGTAVLFPESVDRGRAAAITPVMAVAVHSFLDGVIYSVTFAASFSSGVFAAVSLLLHEFPEGVLTFAILRRHNFGNREAFIWAFVAAAVTTPLGVISVAPFVYGLSADTVGALFAISAGLLIYVATGPLMAPLQEETPLRSFLALGAGVLVAVMIALLPLHEHDDPGGHVSPAPHPMQEPLGTSTP